jgi:hypothetical protein
MSVVVRHPPIAVNRPEGGNLVAADVQDAGAERQPATCAARRRSSRPEVGNLEVEVREGMRAVHEHIDAAGSAP